MPSGFRSLRDLLTFVLGAAGLSYELVAHEAERPTLVIVCAGLMGLPLVLKADEQGSKAELGAGDEATPPEQGRPADPGRHRKQGEA